MRKKKLRPTGSIIDPRPINIYRVNAKSSVGLSRGEFEQSSIRAARISGWNPSRDELGRWAKRDSVDHINLLTGELPLPSTSILQRVMSHQRGL